MSLRTISVEQARKTGICSQCLKNPVAPNRMQCQRCIDTNRRKQQERKVSLRERVQKYAVKIGACTRCYSKPADKPNIRCRACLDYASKRKREATAKKPPSKLGRPRNKKPFDKKEYMRTYHRERRKKKLYEKVRNLALIRHAIADDKPILVEKKGLDK